MSNPLSNGRRMKAYIIICVIFTLYNNSTGRAQNWDTFDKHRQLINSQGLVQRKPCGSDVDLVNDFLGRLNNVTVKVFKKISSASDSHFVFSPLSMWTALAAIAEGTSGQTREELFKFLRLPQEECLRRQFFNLANTLEPSGDDVKLTRSSQLIFDENANLNGDWDHFVRRNSLLSATTAPLKSNPKGAADLIRKSVSLQLPHPNLEGNSVLVDTLNFEGLWTNAFPDAIVEKVPFFDDYGKKVGYVDLMKMKRRVRMTYVPSLNSKVLELPVGYGSRFRMLFGLNVGTSQITKSIPALSDNVIIEIMGNLKESIVPVEVAIPRFRMTTEIDMRRILEDLGVKSLWKDPEGTRNISKPAAMPSSFIQRSTVTMDSTGIRAPIQEVSNIVTGSMKQYEEVETGLDAIIGKDFIADRPFMFALIDAKTHTCLISAVFSQPSYKI